MNEKEIIKNVLGELENAESWYPWWPKDPIHASAILIEECGELHQAILEYTYMQKDSTEADIIHEAVQVAAMAFRFLKHIEEYDYKPSEHIKE